MDVGKPMSRKLQLCRPEMMVTWTVVAVKMEGETDYTWEIKVIGLEDCLAGLWVKRGERAKMTHI